ncbi:MAG TPA: PASTA domain-containing protein [Candidatus Cloacimonadota bacterium]|jgi:serine/threonine-protein kinase|nr:PASTA domain-containing protein [Candidatus Cloacimonadota bacterium]HOF59515.1 PASTA domain-containing protein [Candidatus Cloacimonadota bacterium]HOR58772.1 PASTA domain-containing protein [Candidatus Cloacimonadota bacterium]HPB08075.1 PASTA domain-containing protein [Candidatus Cloacimonadota bacterium]HQL13474.1 PASTA domain-containing protein [Candidatus Cloacimonadota bacterium]
MKKKKSKKALYIIGIGLGIIFLSAFVTSQIIFPVLFGRAKNIEVPNLVGSTISVARNDLKQLGLHVIVRDSVWSEDKKIDTILEQFPEPGKKLKPEGVVQVVVSIGSRMRPVPSLIGATYTEAYMSLRNSGFKAIVADSVYSESYPVNTVVRSSPSANKMLEQGKSVRLYLSRGPEPHYNEDDELLLEE